MTDVVELKTSRCNCPGFPRQGPNPSDKYPHKRLKKTDRKHPEAMEESSGLCHHEPRRPAATRSWTKQAGVLLRSLEREGSLLTL